MTKVIVSQHEAGHGSVRSYTAGFISSLVLTLVAYLFVTHHVYGGWSLIFALSGLALAQLFVQLFFFLHLGRESKPRWNLTVLLFAILVVVMVVFGSLWIMKNLSYDHHAPVNLPDQSIVKDEGYQP